MSRICPGCGGVVGRDCFNPQECVNIGNAMEEDRLQRRETLQRNESEINRLTKENLNLREQVEKLKEVLKEIEAQCDNQNPDHEMFWRIAYGTRASLLNNQDKI